jgi:hypothetical protein
MPADFSTLYPTEKSSAFIFTKSLTTPLDLSLLEPLPDWIAFTGSDDSSGSFKIKTDS